MSIGIFLIRDIEISTRYRVSGGRLMGHGILRGCSHDPGATIKC